ncbi:c-type cytochrome biogenesis protein CcmI [Pseudorhizobium endolithicum]|uniref:C-type cytochrome biogenesis protein CcmI n=1 Tax=Pseudorhizobium endolithicum TaxID=1191678 RepID=A0ABM8PFH6_9HYPH|nr:c-type cytochrome biogenesis protein CcmI [Pseudorhizobium endolithicum]CAD7027145.1 c-type cytochrome biogenesis protein CcmI [Pseudorhizobium endolithicum]
MFLWIILAVLTAAVAAVLLATLARSARSSAPDRAGEIAVYRDQLAELERDRDHGLISAAEAEYAKAEIGRRLLAVAGEAEKGADCPTARTGMTATGVAVTLLVPAVGLSLYLLLGSPQLPDQPLEARLENPGNNMALLVAKAERHLAQNPNDGAGWDLLAPIYFKAMRLGDAELAYRNAIRLLGTSPERLAGLGETLIAANDGIVTEDARLAFEESIRLQPNNPRARFYVALGLEQAGRNEEARTAFEAIAADSPTDAPWMDLIRQHIAATGGAPAETAEAPKGPTADDMAAAGEMSEGDRQDMIRGMVDSLAARLQEDPNNLEGWLRLVRSYSVLGDKDKAAEALRTGLRNFPAEGDEGRQLIALAREVGLAVEGVTQ